MTCGAAGGRRLDGHACGQVTHAARGGRCPWHPDVLTHEQAAEARRAMGRRGAEAQARQRSMPVTHVNLRDPAAIRAATEQVVARLLSGNMSPRAAAAAVGALRLAQTVVAAVDLEERQARLEAAMARLLATR